MKAIFVSLAVLMSLSLASSITPARADADDAAWIKKCVSDNKKEGATADGRRGCALKYQYNL
jgi:hypothetical protein